MNIERETDNIIRTGQLHAYEWRDTGRTRKQSFLWLSNHHTEKEQERLMYSVRRGKSFVQTRWKRV
jgi:hypothetical protein